MQCEEIGNEALQGDKLDVLYGEADVEARERVRVHLDVCAACRDEMAALRGLRRDLAAWRLPHARPATTPRGFVVPRWLAAAALFLLGFGATLGASGYVSLRRALAAQQARAEALEERQRESQRALEAALARAPAAGSDAFLAQVDARIDERLRTTRTEEEQRVARQLADWQGRADVRRRADMAQVAASLSYLDGRHGQQLARTNELLGYFLQASDKR
jgi:DNA segregation ATPase FtsK/SpoIIIE-like protein